MPLLRSYRNLGTHHYKDFAPTEHVYVLSNVQTPKLKHFVLGYDRSVPTGRLASLALLLKPELLAQPLDFFRQSENQFDAGQIRVARGTQVFDAANDADCLLVKTPPTAGGIPDRRH